MQKIELFVRVIAIFCDSGNEADLSLVKLSSRSPRDLFGTLPIFENADKLGNKELRRIRSNTDSESDQYVLLGENRNLDKMRERYNFINRSL